MTATYGDTGVKINASTTGDGGLSYAVKSGDAVTVDGSGNLTIVKAGTAVITVTAVETDTYAKATKDVNVTINKANAVAATVTANNRTYDGTEQPLMTVTGTPTGGTMYYALGENATTAPADNLYTTSIPTATNAGTYYVWYKVIGDENHNNTEPVCITVKIGTGTYSTVSITNSEYTIGDGKDAILTVKGEPDDSKTFDNFDSVEMDGKAVSADNYTTAKGSLILTLKASYLDTLSVGDHKVTIKFKDGTATATLKVNTAGPTPTPKPMPKTGDTGNPFLWLLIALLGISLLGVTMKQYSRK